MMTIKTNQVNNLTVVLFGFVHSPLKKNHISVISVFKEVRNITKTKRHGYGEGRYRSKCNKKYK